MNLEILVNCHVYELFMIDPVGNILLHGVPGLWGLHASSLY